MVGFSNAVRLGWYFFLALSLCAASACAQELAGTYVLLGDSDGTKPITGAKLELTFAGGATGSVKLFAVRPGETVRDSGMYSTAAHQMTIHFKEVDWAADRKPYTFDGCILNLPFMAVSSSSAPGTSTWQREDPKCTGQPAAAAPVASHAPRQPSKPFTSFSADEVLTEGGQHQTIKIHATEKALRSESSEGGQPSIRILRLDRAVMWLLDPQQRTYTELRINAGGGQDQTAVPPGCTVVGEEQIGTHRCQKQVCHVTMPGNEYTETRWVAQDLAGVALRSTDGIRTLELQNLQIGPQDGALFEIPPGYQKSYP